MTLENQNQVAASWKTGDKSQFVMAHALDLLTEVGYPGLTMRGIADRCGMSLSNVQYYYSSKEELITQIADKYFGECGQILSDHFKEYGAVLTRDALRDLVALFLDHGREMNDMCRVFRELWAIGTRNQKIAKLIDDHYERLAQILRENIKYPSADSEAVERMAYMLLVISEGFSIVGHSQMMDYQKSLEFFTVNLECVNNS